MGPDTNLIGQRLRRFREAKGFTQQQLELAIDASFGHISRIESGKINPTKETLLKITEVLKLDDETIRFLICVELEPVNKQQIQEAIQDTKEYLDLSKYPSFLTDDYFFVHFWNKKMLELFQVNLKFAETFRGMNILAIMLHPKFREFMSKQRWESLLINDLVFFMKSVHYFLYPENQVFKDLISSLSKYPEFLTFWNKAEEMCRKAIIPGENLIFIGKENREVSYYMSTINVIHHPRFRIIEYIQNL